MNTSVGIELQNISKTFSSGSRGEVQAVKPLNLTIKPGELITLLGPSGCGKTTTLRMISGFETPTTGKILIGDRDVTNVLANKRDIGFVFQNYALFPHMNVFENVAYGLKIKGMSRSEIKNAVQDVLKVVGLVGFERRFPTQLSGGEQQRVALARVIVVKPKVLMFDEPLSNLDAKRRVQMRDEIRSLQQSLGLTSVYVTHDQEEALSISDRIVVMDNGVVEQVGSPTDIYFSPTNRFVAEFIGKVNRIPGSIIKVDGGNVAVKTSQGVVEVPKPSGEYFQQDAVEVLIRPEMIYRADDQDDFRITGTIVRSAFLGEKVEYDIVLPDETLLTWVNFEPQKASLMSVGQSVAVSFDSSNALISKEVG